MRRGWQKFDHGQPVATLSLAPFAGLLLTMVLLFAALRPPVAHALMVDLPQPTPPQYVGPLSPATNLLAINRDGEISWNSVPISDEQLRNILSSTLTQEPQPVLKFRPDADTAYGRVLGVMGIVADEGLIGYNFCFSGLGEHRQFDKPWSARRMHLTSIFLTDRRTSEFTGFDLPPTFCPDVVMPPLD